MSGGLQRTSGSIGRPIPIRRCLTPSSKSDLQVAGLQDHATSPSHILSLYILRRLRNTVDNYILLTVYFAYIQSILTYGIVLWGSSSNCKNLFILQKRAIRLICNVPNLTSCKPLFVQLRVLTLYSLYIFHLLCFVHGNLELFNINADFHSYNTRNKDCLRVQQYRYSSSQKNWFYFSIKLYNSLPTRIKSLPNSEFKQTMKNVLIDECLYKMDDFFAICWEQYL